MDRISAILADPNSPVSQLMVSNRLPCCGFVTAMQMALAGRVPTNPDKLGNWNFPSDNEWERGCLWAGYGHWDNLPKPRFILTPIEPLVLDYILTTRPHSGGKYRSGTGTTPAVTTTFFTLLPETSLCGSSTAQLLAV